MLTCCESRTLNWKHHTTSQVFPMIVNRTHRPLVTDTSVSASRDSVARSAAHSHGGRPEELR